jgi:hypothetical protein
MKYLTIINDETWSKTKYEYVKDRIAYGEIFMGMFSEIFYGTQLTLCDVPEHVATANMDMNYKPLDLGGPPYFQTNPEPWDIATKRAPHF